MGPRSCWLLQKYWGRLRMVTKEGGYYGLAFQGFREVTQGDLLSSTILNEVVNAVASHWVEVMVESAYKQSGRGQEGRHQHSLFYTDDGMVALSDPRLLQGEFSTLVGLFNRVGLKTTVRKTFVMVCCQCQAAGTQSEAAYGRRITGAGPY